MIISVLTLTFLEGKVQEGLAAVHGSLKTTRAFDGCLGVDVAQDVSDPQRVVIVERWKSLAHDTAYRDWATKNGARSNVGACIAGPPAKSICELLDGV